MLALFRERPGAGCWGAVAKSNYSGLRFRSPVYRSLRELVMSYFDDYYNLEGEKSLRAFERPVDLARFDARGWETAEESLWDVSTYLATRRFTPLLTRAQVRALGPMDRRLYDAGLVGTSVLSGERDRVRVVAQERQLAGDGPEEPVLDGHEVPVHERPEPERDGVVLVAAGHVDVRAACLERAPAGEDLGLELELAPGAAGLAEKTARDERDGQDRE